MAQVMESQIGQEGGIGFGVGGGAVGKVELESPRLAACPHTFHARWCFPGEHLAIDAAGQGLQGRNGFAGQGHNAERIAILGFPPTDAADATGTPGEVNISPAQRQDFTGAGRSLHGEDEHLPQAHGIARALGIGSTQQVLVLCLHQAPLPAWWQLGFVDGVNRVAGRQGNRQFLFREGIDRRQHVEVMNDALTAQAGPEQVIPPCRHIDAAHGADEVRAEPSLNAAHVLRGTVRLQPWNHRRSVAADNIGNRDLSGIVAQDSEIAPLDFTLDLPRPGFGVGFEVKGARD
ncbi:hypothetical protein THIX_60441 [Thiomonas sp. X19]|nr:hypothetical protein THIX_60441 [Thiomonas sp. X19]